MSKSILVIDTPNCCSECPLCLEDWQSREWCGITNERVLCVDKLNSCPLKPLPKKMEGYDSIKWQWGEYEDGWNHCIDSILGE